MPMYSPPVRGNQSAAQQMQTIGRGAPQQGNYGGGQASGAASTQRVPGLATALSGSQQAAPTGPQRPAATGASTAPRIPTSGGYTVPPQRQPSPAQGQNRAFANWGEPGSVYGQPPQQQPGQTWTGAPVQGYRMDTGGGMNAMMERRQGGPQMMGPATGQMSLSGAINSAPTNRGFWNDLGQGAQNAFQQWAQSTQADQETSGQSGSGAQAEPTQSRQLTPQERQAAINDGLDPNDPAVIAMFNGQQQTRDGSTGNIVQDLQNDANYNQGFGGIPTTNGNTRGTIAGAINREAQNLGYESGRAAGAFPAGMAEALNKFTKEDMMKYYDDMRDIEKLKTQGESLMDPEQQAAADAAERAQMQAGINSQRDEQLRMMMGQQGRGGMVGSGASTGLLNSALRAQALGEQNLAQDQYQRMLGRNQLGGQLISDYGRQKYGLMNDAYASPMEIASLLLQATQAGAGILDKLPMNMAELTGIG